MQQTNARVPVPGFGNGALKVGAETEKVALELVVGTGLVHAVGLVGIGCFVIGSVAVIAVEVAHLVGQVGDVDAEAVVGDEVFGVVGEAEKAVLLGGVGRLGIEGVVVVRIDRSIAKIIDIGEGPVLESEVGIVGHTGQHTESPSLADSGGVLRRKGANGKRGRGEKNQ